MGVSLGLLKLGGDPSVAGAHVLVQVEGEGRRSGREEHWSVIVGPPPLGGRKYFFIPPEGGSFSVLLTFYPPPIGGVHIVLVPVSPLSGGFFLYC